MFPLQLPFSAQSRVIAAASALGLPSSRLIFHARTAFESHLLQVTRHVVLSVFSTFHHVFLNVFSTFSDVFFFAETKRRPCARHAALQLPHQAHHTLFISRSFSSSTLFFSGCDILWAGVPLLTLPTSTMSGRVAASLLRAALPPPAAASLIARTLDGDFSPSA